VPGLAKERSYFPGMGECDDRWVRTAVGWRLASRHCDMRGPPGDYGLLGS